MKENKWIRIEDKLPKVRTRVLIYTNYNIVEESVFVEGDLFLDYADRSITATHWMQLPDAPK